MVKYSCFLILTFFCFSIAVKAGDWPQFMLNSEHNGNAEHEELKFPLGLEAQIKLDDAVTTSPAIVGGLVYVVDQMGTAYCLDSQKGKIIWKVSPEGVKAFGSNTSSPCVINGRVYYGTTAGNFHILNAKDGKVIKTIHLGWGVTCSPTYANDSIYFQTVGAKLHCLDLDGKERWQWDHYINHPPNKKGGIDGRNRPHYGYSEVAVSGKFIVSSFGVDNFCLEDTGSKPSIVWCYRSTRWRGAGPMSSSIANGYVYTAYPGSDGHGGGIRIPLRAIMKFEKYNSLRNDKKSWWYSQKTITEKIKGFRGWNIYGLPAVRGSSVYYGVHSKGLVRTRFNVDKKKGISSGVNSGGIIGSPVLTKNNCVCTTVNGEMLIYDLKAWRKKKPFRFQTPHYKMIISSPAISNGKVFFGCDDGFLYVLGPNGTLKPKKVEISLHHTQSQIKPATGKKYGMTTSSGSSANTNFVDDPLIKPPFKLRWVVRTSEAFKQAPCATQDDIIYVSLTGTVAVLEQMTARLRWRKRLPESVKDGAGVLCIENRIFIARTGIKAKNFVKSGKIYCLDQANGEILWSKEIGYSGNMFLSAGPVFADGIVALGSIKGKPPISVVEAWDIKSGELVWEKKQKDLGEIVYLNGCGYKDMVYFSGGGYDRKTKKRLGKTIALKAKTGEVIWETTENYSLSKGIPAFSDGKLILSGGKDRITCLSASDGKLIWKSKRAFTTILDSLAITTTFIGIGSRDRIGGFNLSIENLWKGNDGHRCGGMLVTSGGLSSHATVAGIYIREIKTGRLLWNTEKGFAIRACPHPIISNGRLFYAPQVNGMLYCFEPEHQIKFEKK